MDERVTVVCSDPVRRATLRDQLGAQGLTTTVALAPSEGLHTAPLALLLVPAQRDELAVWADELGRAETMLPSVVLGTAGIDAQFALGLALADFAPADSSPAELAARIRLRVARYRYIVALRRQKEAATVVLELTQALSSQLELRDILHLVVRRIAEVVAVDRVSIVLGGDRDTAYVVAASDDESLRNLPIKMSAYPEISRALETGMPVQIEDARGDPMFTLAGVTGPTRFRALTCFPILYEGRPMGVLFLRNAEPRTLADEEVFLIRAVANATGIALRNARLLRELRDQTNQSRFEHIEAQMQLRALQRYADFFDSSADGILVVALDGAILFCNPAACSITGRAESDLRRIRFDDILPPDGRRQFEELRASFERGVFASNVDLPVLNPAGERRILSVSFNSVLREDEGVIVSLRDVTADRATARELTKTKEFLQRVIDSSVDAIVSADMRGNVLLFNPAAERTYGYVKEDVIGKLNVAALYPADAAREIMRRMRAAGAGGVLVGYETELLGKGGERIPVLLSASLIVHRERPIGSVGVFRDLRSSRQMEAHLAAAREELRAHEKTALIAELAGATAHELNQPLTAVMGYATLLAKRATGDEKVTRAAERMVAETERMAEIVRKIGKLTKYETKTYVGDTKILDLDRSVESEPPISRY